MIGGSGSPHCSAFYVRDVNALLRTFEILPEYLKTADQGRVKNYRDWGIQLGRRFRALKLWFVLSSYGLDGLQEKLRHHIQMAQDLADAIRASGDFEVLAPVPLNTICFRFKPPGLSDEETLNALNMRLLDSLNATGKVFLTHTRLHGKFALRIVIGQTEVRQQHVDHAWDLIQHMARASGDNTREFVSGTA